MGLAVYIGFITIGIYSIIILFYAFGWRKLKTFISDNQKKAIPVSIVIACRNEEKNILSHLKSLTKQNYSTEKTEIIIVDDHSEDNTKSIISRYIKDFNHIQLLNLPETYPGKKEALALGIRHSKSGLIITTDADCVMNPDWLNTMMQYYISYKPMMLSGPVTFMQSKSIFHKFQNLEFLSLIGTGAGSISIKRPIMCNGANLLFEKSLYKKCNVKNNIASGDDIFLLLNSKKESTKSIHFIKSYDAIVYTRPASSIKTFFHQRIRWTSKNKAYRDFDIICTAIFVTLANVTIIASLIFSLWSYSFLKLFAIIFLIKSITDLTILIPVSRFFRQTSLIWFFLPLQIIYPLYILLTFIFGIFGNFNWKGRKFN